MISCLFSGDLREIVWPAGLLEPYVVLHGGLPIVTLTPEMHLRMKAVVASPFGVEPRPKDLMDTAALDLHLSERPSLS
ncbi:MAG: hypothetical protein ACR2J4_09435 [Deinococcus sp.]